jgi:hypothetical protein
MISLTVTVDNLTTVTEIFTHIELRRYRLQGTPVEGSITDIVADTYYTSISGIDTISNVNHSREDVTDILLVSSPTPITQYYFTDPTGIADNWYISRYVIYNDVIEDLVDSASGWSDPIQGEAENLYYNPQFPPEISYGSADQLIIDRIRLYTGDPLNLRREYGEDAVSSIHTDGRTYEMDEFGWPVYVNMGGIPYTSTNNPSVNGYKFLRFNTYIADICYECVTYSGVCGEDVVKEVANGIDVWYYTFRHSDRQIMEAYNTCPPPTPLTTLTANAEAYMLQTAIDLLHKELWEDATEDGASIADEGSTYSPGIGLQVRKALLDDLKKRLADLTKILMLSGVQGVRVD